MELNLPANHYTLTYTGDSLCDIGIQDGDTVIIRHQGTAKDGDIVVALINRAEATLKRYFRHDDSIELRPENFSAKSSVPLSKFTSDFYPPEQIEIQGKLVGIYRQY